MLHFQNRLVNSLWGVCPCAVGVSWKMTGMRAWRMALSQALATSRPTPLFGVTLQGEGEDRVGASGGSDEPGDWAGAGAGAGTEDGLGSSPTK